MIVRTIIASRFMDAPRRTHSPPDRSVTKKKHFRTYSRRELFYLPKLCMVVELVVPILKVVNHFQYNS